MPGRCTRSTRGRKRRGSGSRQPRTPERRGASDKDVLFSASGPTGGAGRLRRRRWARPVRTRRRYLPAPADDSAFRVYDVIVAAAAGGSVTAHLRRVGRGARARDDSPAAADTVLVAGGDDRGHRAWRRRTPRSRAGWCARRGIVRRIGSVCDGAFIVASAGILDGQRAATHWSSCDRLARLLSGDQRRPRMPSSCDDGRVWTSAGVSDRNRHGAGDGRGRSRPPAGRHRRRASRALCSPSRIPVAVQRGAGGADVGVGSARPGRGVVAREPARSARRGQARPQGRHVGALAAPSLSAARSAPRRRSSSRSCASSRRERCWRRRSSGPRSIAARCGFGSAPRMARAFERALGVAPRAYRMMFATAKS